VAPVIRLLGNDADQFAIASNGCASQLPAGGVCRLTVQFTPAIAGLKTATLGVAAGPDVMATSTLIGTAVSAGALTVDLSSKDFGSVPVGVTSLPVRFAVSNGGMSATGPISTRIVGTTDFAILGDGCGGAPLAAQATCTIDVTLKPSSAGPKNATLEVGASPGGTTSASLTGQGATPARVAMLSASTTTHDF
jgi:hypothetical protein